METDKEEMYRRCLDKEGSHHSMESSQFWKNVRIFSPVSNFFSEADVMYREQGEATGGCADLEGRMILVVMIKSLR